MIKKEKNGLCWFEFDLLQSCPHVKHGCFTRLGGTSCSPFASLNVGLVENENPSSVFENRKKIQKILVGNGTLIDCNQVHGSDLTCITTTPSSPCDGLITHQPNTTLLIKHADCQAALFFDPEHNVIANVHAGWRGSVQNIYAKTVHTLHTTYGTNPHLLLACISPSLGPDHAEFINWQKELPPSFSSFQKRPNYFNFWKISRMQLLECGLLPEHVEIASLCTYELKDLFFSHRRDKGITGRNATCIALTQH